MAPFDRLGPHIQEILPNTDAWVLNCPTVKSVGIADVFDLPMPPGAITIYRKVTNNQNINDNGATFAASVIADLGGRRPTYIEGYNETSQKLGQGLEQYVIWMQQFSDYAHGQGYKVAGFSFSTGQPGVDDWDYLRAHGFSGVDAVAMHAYWCNSGFTMANALYFSLLWQPGDPDIVLTEVGRDAVDGCAAAGDKAQGASDEQFVGELEDFDGLLVGYPYVRGAAIFTESSEPKWSNFNIDNLAALLGWSHSVLCGGYANFCCLTDPICDSPYVCQGGVCLPVGGGCPCPGQCACADDGCSCASGGPPTDYTPYVVGGVALLLVAAVAAQHHHHTTNVVHHPPIIHQPSKEVQHVPVQSPRG